MKIGRFDIEEFNNEFHVKLKGQTLDMFPTIKEAMLSANIYNNIYQMAYAHGKSDMKNEYIDANKYHYM